MGAGAEITAFSLHCIPATPASCNNNGNDAGDWDVEPLFPDSTSPHGTMYPRYMDPSWKVCLSVYSNIIYIPKMLVFFPPLSLTTQTPQDLETIYSLPIRHQSIWMMSHQQAEVGADNPDLSDVKCHVPHLVLFCFALKEYYNWCGSTYLQSEHFGGSDRRNRVRPEGGKRLGRGGGRKGKRKLRGKNDISGVLYINCSCHFSGGKELKTKEHYPARIFQPLQSTGKSLQSKTEWIHKFRSLSIKSLISTQVSILMTTSNPNFPLKGSLFKHHQCMKLEAQPPAWELWGTLLKYNHLPSCSCLLSTQQRSEQVLRPCSSFALSFLC